MGCKGCAGGCGHGACTAQSRGAAERTALGERNMRTIIQQSPRGPQPLPGWAQGHTCGALTPIWPDTHRAGPLLRGLEPAPGHYRVRATAPVERDPLEQPLGSTDPLLLQQRAAPVGTCGGNMPTGAVLRGAVPASESLAL